ncbi:TonB family protein [Flavobacterium gossypii]|uniref:TonB family protein n=1 Tax=Flavobacterium gossypii TaxID=1646119 RepID=A0ABR6DQ11_9FLAO|nr:energy transducer TonB [Flavobacterium gossypii]MBA9073781.1 TonB family protein [Flavobacterium gossypii]
MKSTLLSALFLMMPVFLLAQNGNDKKIFLDSLERSTDKEDYKYFKIVKNYNIPSETYDVKNYYRSGKLYGEGKTVDSLGFNKIGKFTTYYENGNKKSEGSYNKSTPTGPHKTWHENGKLEMDGEYFETEKSVGNLRINQFYDAKGKQTVKDGNGTYEDESYGAKFSGAIKNGLKEGDWKGSNPEAKTSFVEIYEGGNFVSGETTDADHKKYPYTKIIETPQPYKGIQDFYKFVSKNYNPGRINGTLKGKIMLSFVIEKDGSVADIKVVKSLDEKLDREGIRVVKAYKDWKPGKVRGIFARVSFALPIALSFE